MILELLGSNLAIGNYDLPSTVHTEKIEIQKKRLGQEQGNICN